MLSDSVGLIGAGRMATALAHGLVRAKLVLPERLVVSDPLADARARFAQEMPGVNIADDNRVVARGCNVLILAVKPQQIVAVLNDIHDSIQANALVVSIAAGFTLQRLAEGLPDGTPLVRVMPNTPCLIGKGSSAYSLGRHATKAQGELVGRMLSAVGQAFEVPEKLLDAVTGLSGSGPAFVYTVVEALIDGGVLMGLPRDLAHKLTIQTVAGAAELVIQTDEHPARLRDQVASPGGTTMAGLEAIEAGGLRATLIQAVRAATMRSQELQNSD